MSGLLQDVLPELKSLALVAVLALGTTALALVTLRLIRRFES